MTDDALAEIEYRDEPAVIVFGDAEPALERSRRTAALARCRVAAAVPVGEAAERLAQLPACYPVLLEVGAAEGGPALAALLDRLQADAESCGRSSVVIAPPALIDLVAARVSHPRIRHLCEASEPERVAALAAASRPPPDRLHDIGRESGALLLQLSEEVGRIASILASLSDEEAAALAGPPTLRGGEADDRSIDAAHIRSLIRARRLRDQYFRGDLFADPAWDMLLDLMAARLEKNRVAVSSLCIAAAVPATTALRWIKALTDRGLFVRSADPEDGRRVYIELSDDAARALASYLKAAQRIAPAPI